MVPASAPQRERERERRERGRERDRRERKYSRNRTHIRGRNSKMRAVTRRGGGGGGVHGPRWRQSASQKSESPSKMPPTKKTAESRKTRRNLFFGRHRKLSLHQLPKIYMPSAVHELGARPGKVPSGERETWGKGGLQGVPLVAWCLGKLSQKKIVLLRD